MKYNKYNHNYNKILKSDWLSTVPISALISQCNRTVHVMPKLLDSMHHWARVLTGKWLISCVLILKKDQISQILLLSSYD